MEDLNEAYVSAARERLIYHIAGKFLADPWLSSAESDPFTVSKVVDKIIAQLEGLGMQVEPLEYNARKPTREQLERHGIVPSQFGIPQHVPGIVHRTGGISAEKLNTCGLCGAQIIPSVEHGGWISISDEMADQIRRRG